MHKIIAISGYCSRRKAEKLILAGKVKVNDQTITKMGIKVSENDEISVEGNIINHSVKNVYIMFYKPKNCLTTLDDPLGRKTIMHNFKNYKTRIYPVGRLDYDVTGFLLMTNDGDFTNKIIHPKHNIDKKYRALVKGVVKPLTLKPMLFGMEIDDYKTSPAQYEIIQTDHLQNNSIVDLTIHEGKNHQVKKMFKKVGLRVLELKRLKIGNIDLDKDLEPGDYRDLTEDELKNFKKLF